MAHWKGGGRWTRYCPRPMLMSQRIGREVIGCGRSTDRGVISIKSGSGQFISDLSPDMSAEADSFVLDRLLGGSEDYVLPLDPPALCSTSPISASPFYRSSPASTPEKRRQFSFMVR